MKILFTSTESAPFFKTGGLGDVVGALPKELVRQGQEVSVVLPYLTDVLADSFKSQMKDEFTDYVEFGRLLGWRREKVQLKSLKLEGVVYYFLANDRYFTRDSIYGYLDDEERWAFFTYAIAQLLKRIGIPDIVHINDFHTAMLPFLIKEKYSWLDEYKEIKTVLTIHNAQFQGFMNVRNASDLYDMDLVRDYPKLADETGTVKSLYTGVVYADHVTAVSPGYAKEILTHEFGYGLEKVLTPLNGKLSGILNGIDYEVYDPESDPFLTQHFSVSDLTGKAASKEALQKRVGLPVLPNVPILGMVSRLTRQKGFDLLLEKMAEVLQEEVQVVLIGTGEAAFEDQFKAFAVQYPDKFSANIAFDLQFAQEIYAGSDFFLMPSAFEPCGLSQMIAMRYGTLPIVHEVGGLRDTVIAYEEHPDLSTGFGFGAFDSNVLLETIREAVQLYRVSPQAIREMQTRGMTQDFAWTNRAKEYLEMYAKL